MPTNDDNRDGNVFDFVRHRLCKDIETSRNDDELETNVAILGLYDKGLIDVWVNGGEIMVELKQLTNAQLSDELDESKTALWGDEIIGTESPLLSPPETE